MKPAQKGRGLTAPSVRIKRPRSLSGCVFCRVCVTYVAGLPVPDSHFALSLWIPYGPPVNIGGLFFVALYFAPAESLGSKDF